ncbi:hypothetical protein WP50_13590, partial [Lactiplantibacillus plantarum]
MAESPFQPKPLEFVDEISLPFLSDDGATRTLTVSYTQASGKVLTWKTTVASSYQAMAMVVSASTGAAKNLQQ